MTHLNYISRRPAPAQDGVTTPLESAIITVMTILFGHWINGPTVISNLSDFFAKTPEGV
jgi:hypothetical protein